MATAEVDDGQTAFRADFLHHPIDMILHCLLGDANSSAILSKRKSFTHERELRALIWTMQNGKNGWGEFNKLKEVHELYVPVSLEKLVEAVYVAPTAEKWAHDLLESLAKRFGLNVPIRKSSLSDGPIY